LFKPLCVQYRYRVYTTYVWRLCTSWTGFCQPVGHPPPRYMPWPPFWSLSQVALVLPSMCTRTATECTQHPSGGCVPPWTRFCRPVGHLPPHYMLWPHFWSSSQVVLVLPRVYRYSTDLRVYTNSVWRLCTPWTGFCQPVGHPPPRYMLWLPFWSSSQLVPFLFYHLCVHSTDYRVYTTSVWRLCTP
jgi:hypothetical protein